MLDKYKLIMESNFKKIISNTVLSGDEYDDIITRIQSGEASHDIASKSKLTATDIDLIKRNIKDRNAFNSSTDTAGPWKRDYIKGISKNKIIAVVELDLHRLFYKGISKPEDSFIGIPGAILCNTAAGVTPEDIEPHIDAGIEGWMVFPFDSDTLAGWNTSWPIRVPQNPDQDDEWSDIYKTSYEEPNPLNGEPSTDAGYIMYPTQGFTAVRISRVKAIVEINTDIISTSDIHNPKSYTLTSVDSLANLITVHGILELDAHVSIPIRNSKEITPEFYIDMKHHNGPSINRSGGNDVFYADFMGKKIAVQQIMDIYNVPEVDPQPPYFIDSAIIDMTSAIVETGNKSLINMMPQVWHVVKNWTHFKNPSTNMIYHAVRAKLRNTLGSILTDINEDSFVTLKGFEDDDDLGNQFIINRFYKHAGSRGDHRSNSDIDHVVDDRVRSVMDAAIITADAKKASFANISADLNTTGRFNLEYESGDSKTPNILSFYVSNHKELSTASQSGTPQQDQIDELRDKLHRERFDDIEWLPATDAFKAAGMGVRYSVDHRIANDGEEIELWIGELKSPVNIFIGVADPYGHAVSPLVTDMHIGWYKLGLWEHRTTAFNNSIFTSGTYRSRVGSNSKYIQLILYGSADNGITSEWVDSITHEQYLPGYSTQTKDVDFPFQFKYTQLHHHDTPISPVKLSSLFGYKEGDTDTEHEYQLFLKLTRDSNRFDDIGKMIDVLKKIPYISLSGKLSHRMGISDKTNINYLDESRVVRVNYMPFKNKKYRQKSQALDVLVDNLLDSTLEISDQEAEEREALLTPGRMEKMLAIDKFFVDMLDSSLFTYDKEGNLDSIEDLFRSGGGEIKMPAGAWRTPLGSLPADHPELDHREVKRDFDEYVKLFLPIIEKLRVLNHTYMHIGHIYDRPPDPNFTWEGHIYRDWLLYTDVINRPVDVGDTDNMSWDFIAYLKKRKMGDLSENDNMVEDLLKSGWSYDDIGGMVQDWPIPEEVKSEWLKHPEEYGDSN
jgi:hypothetical protein